MSRLALMEDGYLGAANLTDEQMEQLASKVGDALADCGWWHSMRIVAEECFNLKPKEM